MKIFPIRIEISAVRDRLITVAGEPQTYRPLHAVSVALLALIAGVLLEQRSWLSAIVALVVVGAAIWLGPEGIDPDYRADYDPEWDDEYGEELQPGLRVVRNDPRKPW